MRYLSLVIFLGVLGCLRLAADAVPVDGMKLAKTVPAGADEFSIVEYIAATDGDTFTVNLPNARSDVFGKRVPVRIRHIDTAEMKGSGNCEKTMALKAKALTDSILSSAKKIDLENPGRDKYWRILADVRADGVLVSDVLLSKHLAIPYEGETKLKVNWCQMAKKS